MVCAEQLEVKFPQQKNEHMNSASVHDGVSRVGVFFSSHPDLLVITDAAGAALDVNELARRTLPAELGAGAGASLADCVHPEDRDATASVGAGRPRKE